MRLWVDSPALVLMLWRLQHQLWDLSQIPDHERDRVFERFTQVDQSDTRSKGGTGLGLSIVKSLTEVMRGSVRVEETEGGGATFVVELPLAPALQSVD